MRANNYADLGHFGPFWAVLGRFGPFYVPKMDILVFQKNGLLILGHASAPLAPIAPLKTAKHLFWKQECPKKGHASAPLAPIAPPENGKTFILETRMPQKGTCICPIGADCTP
jgi:hypothetical protein